MDLQIGERGGKKKSFTIQLPEICSVVIGKEKKEGREKRRMNFLQNYLKSFSFFHLPVFPPNVSAEEKRKGKRR